MKLAEVGETDAVVLCDRLDAALEFIGIIFGAQKDDGAGLRRHAKPLLPGRARDTELQGCG
jgi:hypothetical protein